MKKSPGIGHAFPRGTRLIYILLILTVGLFFTAVPLMAQPFVLHVSSCKSANNASEEVAGYRALGMDAFSRYENVPGKGMWHRVYIGRYQSQQQASAAAQKFKSQGVITYASVQPFDPIMRRAPKTAGPTYTPPPPRPKPTPQKANVARFEPQVVSPRPQTGPQVVSPRVQTGPAGQYDALLREETTKPAPRTAPPPPPPRSSTRIVSEPLAPPTATAQGPATQAPPNTREPMPQTQGVQQQPPPNTREPVPQQQAQVPPPPPKQRQQRRSRQQYEPKPDTGFSIGARAGITIWPDCDDLVIQEINNGKRHQISRDTTPVHFAAVPAWRFNDVVTLEGSIEKPHAPNIDAWYFTFGPKVNFPINENFSPYVRTGVVYGLFDWDKVPGSFRDSWGWEFGTGLDYYLGRFSFGFDALYRDIKFKYRPPSGQTVLTNRSKQNLSGYSFSGTFGYHF